MRKRRTEPAGPPLPDRQPHTANRTLPTAFLPAFNNPKSTILNRQSLLLLSIASSHSGQRRHGTSSSSRFTPASGLLILASQFNFPLSAFRFPLSAFRFPNFFPNASPHSLSTFTPCPNALAIMHERSHYLQSKAMRRPPLHPRDADPRDRCPRSFGCRPQF